MYDTEKTLKDLREASGYTQDGIATELGCSESYYSLLENGKRRMSLDTGRKLSILFGVTTDEIFLSLNLTKRKDTA